MATMTGSLSQTSVEIIGQLSEASVEITGSMSQTILDHSMLKGRDSANQHPIEAITNLEAELDYRPGAALTNEDIQLILNT